MQSIDGRRLVGWLDTSILLHYIYIPHPTSVLLEWTKSFQNFSALLNENEGNVKIKPRIAKPCVPVFEPFVPFTEKVGRYEDVVVCMIVLAFGSVIFFYL